MKSAWLLCLLLIPLTSMAQVTPGQIDLLASEAQPQVVEWRRWFHQNPELSNREFDTAEKVAEALREMGLGTGHGNRPHGCGGDHRRWQAGSAGCNTHRHGRSAGHRTNRATFCLDCYRQSTTASERA